MKQLSISQKKILLVEGQDEFEIINKFLTSLEIKDIQVISADGKNNIGRALMTISVTSGFDDIQAIGVIRDADNNATAAFDSVKNDFAKIGFPTPDKIGVTKDSNNKNSSIFLLPGGLQTGMLETLMWETVSDHQVANSVDSFLRDCQAILQAADGSPLPEGPPGWRQPRNIDKARIFALLSTMVDPLTRLGIAVNRNYFDLTHNALADLSNYLRAL